MGLKITCGCLRVLEGPTGNISLVLGIIQAGKYVQNDGVGFISGVSMQEQLSNLGLDRVPSNGYWIAVPKPQ